MVQARDRAVGKVVVEMAAVVLAELMVSWRRVCDGAAVDQSQDYV